MYFPHRYRTLNGRTGGKGGLPVPYDYNQIEEIELYDLSKDISETNNLATNHPKIIEKIKLLAEEMRDELGDALLEKKGIGNREIGKVE